TRIIPMIAYQSVKKGMDDKARETEAAVIQDEFNKLYPGMHDYFDKIMVRVTEEDPSTATKEVKFKDTVLKTK
ncbi:MAG: hypothetical protein RR829_02660, partial [Oscillospiraceae bacterium]